MPGVVKPSETMAKAGNEIDDGGLDDEEHDVESTKYATGDSQNYMALDYLPLQRFDSGVCCEHVSTPSCSPPSSPYASGIGSKESIEKWINSGTPTNSSHMRYLSPIAFDSGDAGSSASDQRYMMCPQAHPDLDWDELFALTDYMGVANKNPYFGNNNNDVSPLPNPRNLTSPPECDGNNEELFDVFVNPAAYSASDESEERLSSVDSESTLSTTSETDSDASSTRPRKSSLRKRPHTPPGNPSRKSVRFADALGLDLETVKHILEMDSCPSSPMPVLLDSPLHGSQTNSKSVHMCFEQPGGRPDFLQRVCQQNICLENVMVSDMTVIGTIKVRNLDFCKEVRVRYSWDNWTTHANIMARYVAGSCDGPTDRFSFGFTIPRRYVGVGDKVFFAVFYKVAGQEYWDNNNGYNYMLLIEEEVRHRKGKK